MPRFPSAFIDLDIFVFSETLGANFIDGKNQDEEKVGNVFKARILQCLGRILSELFRIYVVVRLINVLSPSLARGLLLLGVELHIIVSTRITKLIT